MNNVLKNGGTTVDLIWQQNEKQIGIRLLSLIQRPYEQELPEDPRLAAMMLARNEILNMTQKGFEIKPTSHLHSIDIDKFPAEYSQYIGSDMESAENLMELNLDAQDLFTQMGDKPIKICVIETTNLEWLKFRFGKLMAQKGDDFWDWALEKIVKRSTADSDGNQFYLFNNQDPILRFTELIPTDSAAANMGTNGDGHEWTEYTHRVSLSWKFGMEVTPNVVDTREDVKATFRAGTKPDETTKTNNPKTPGGQVQQKMNQANAETTA